MASNTPAGAPAGAPAPKMTVQVDGPLKRKQGLSGKEVADREGVDKSTVTLWDRQGWVVRYEDKSIDYEATMEKVRANRHPTVGGKPDRGLRVRTDTDVGEGINAERLRKARADADMAELNVLKAQGQLIPVEDAIREYTTIFASARQNLEAVATRLAPLLVTKTDELEIRQLIQRELDTALRSIAEIPGVRQP